jgi:hypothetical protein
MFAVNVFATVGSGGKSREVANVCRAGGKGKHNKDQQE